MDKTNPIGNAFLLGGAGFGLKAVWAFLACLIFAGACLASAGQAAPQTERHHRESWRVILAEKNRELALMQEIAQEVRVKIRVRRKQLDNDLLDVQAQYLEMLAVLHASLYDPYEVSLIFRSFNDLRGSLKKRLIPFEQLDSQVELYKENMRQSLNELEAFPREKLGRKLAAQVSNFEKQLRLAEKIMELTLKESREATEPLRSMIQRVSNRIDAISSRSYAIWNSIFWDHSTSVFTEVVWVNLIPDTYAWSLGLWRFLQPRLAFEPDDWFNLGMALLFIFCPLVILGLWLLRRALSEMGSQNPNAAAYFKGFIFLAPLAIAMLASCSMMDYPEVWLWDVLAMLTPVLAAIYLARGLRALKSVESGANVMSQTFWLYVLLCFCHFTDIPVSLAAILWSAALLLALIRAYRQEKAGLNTLELCIRWCGMAVLAGLLALSVMGYLLLSALLLKFWLVIGVAVLLGHRLGQFVDHAIAKARDRGKSMAAQLGIGLYTPLIWIALAALSVLWLAHHMGGTRLLIDLVEHEVQIGPVTVSLSHLLIILLMFFAFRYMAILSKALMGFLGREKHIEDGLVASLQTVCTYAIWTVFIISVLKLLGLGLTSLLVIAGGMSVGIGFGLQNIVNNFVSGLIILIGRSLHQGDIIEVGGRLGRVVKINIRSTVIKTRDNNLILVPNSDIISKSLINWTREDRRLRRDILVGTAYGSDPEQVQALLMHSIKGQAHVLQNPKPKALFWEFGDSALIFKLRVWVDTFGNRRQVESDLRGKIYKLFEQHGIEIAFPQLDVHLRDMTSKALDNAPPGSSISLGGE